MPGAGRSGRRRRRGASRGPILSAGATDEFRGLGRVEQLVLRGDGLTTTSLEILTGERITVSVVGHWRITVPENPPPEAGASSMQYGDDGPDVEYYLATGKSQLGARAGDVLLIRDVLLVGPTGSVHGSAEVVALLHLLPDPVAAALAATDQPIGRLLRDTGVPVTRELLRWGLATAGPCASSLRVGLHPTSRVPARTYLMRLANTGQPLAVLTERFSPVLFQ